MGRAGILKILIEISLPAGLESVSAHKPQERIAQVHTVPICVV